MVKENTHLYFADKIKSKLPKDIRKIVESNFEYYLVGSVSPDIFFYSKKLGFISDELHGQGKEKSNKLILEFINSKKLNEKDLAFLFGYMTHYSADINFHPVIYYLTGNYYNLDKLEAQKSIYRHRLLETQFDKSLNHNFLVSQCIRLESLKNCSFFIFIQRKYKISSNEMNNLFSKFIKYNIYFKSKIVFKIFSILSMVKLVQKSVLPLFYEVLNQNKININLNNFKIKNLFSGKEKTTSVKYLEDKTIKESLKYIKALFNYKNKKISLNDLKKVYLGKSLNTGTFNKVDKIKYFKK